MRVVTIGRSSNNNIVINDGQVSRNHCQIIQDNHGNFRLIDTNSANGTYVNGVRRQGEVHLNQSDIIRIGNTTLPWQTYFGGNAGTGAGGRTIVGSGYRGGGYDSGGTTGSDDGSTTGGDGGGTTGGGGTTNGGYITITGIPAAYNGRWAGFEGYSNTHAILAVASLNMQAATATLVQISGGSVRLPTWKTTDGNVAQRFSGNATTDGFLTIRSAQTLVFHEGDHIASRSWNRVVFSGGNATLTWAGGYDAD